MANKVTFGRESLDKILKGLDIAADAVGGTLGPKGKNVYLDDVYTPRYTNDGATIADRIVLKDKLENLGAYVIRNASSQTNDDAGDGTTTTAVILQSIIHECLKRPENPMEIRKSLNHAKDEVIKLIKKYSKKIGDSDIERVALISSENEHIAKMIAEIINKIGNKASMHVQDSTSLLTDYEIVEGYEANVGFLSPYFINNSKTNQSIHEDIPVLVVERRIQNMIDIKPIFDKITEAGLGKCAVITYDIDDTMLGVVVMSKLKGVWDGVVIKAMDDVLHDFEGVSGATMISDKTGVTFQNVELKHLGRAKRIISDAHKTLLIGDGARGKIRAMELEKRADKEPNMYLREMQRERAAKLRGGVALIKIGAPTDGERGYLKDKAEDAVKAVKAALEEGIVEGGGMALWRIANELPQKTVGEQILKKALQSPLKKIIENGGKDYTEIVTKMTNTIQFRTRPGYDARNDKLVELIPAGIIDPAKVERCAVQNAISAAGSFITQFASIVADEEDKK